MMLLYDICHILYALIFVIVSPAATFPRSSRCTFGALIMGEPGRRLLPLKKIRAFLLLPTLHAEMYGFSGGKTRRMRNPRR